MALVLTARYASPEAFLLAFDTEVSRRGLLVHGAQAQGAPAMTACSLVVEVPGAAAVQVPARVAAVVPGVGVAVVLEDVPEALRVLAEGLRAPPAAEDAGPAEEAADEAPEGAPRLLSERLKAMNVTQKMQLALSGGREERLALFRDVNKVLHVYVLRNPRIGLDEVQHAAKQPTLSPDALKLIADHREWGANATVCTALVKNPRTPLPIALRLLDKVPPSEVRAMAKGGARDQIVQAARKKLGGAPG
jgi:hypothetical protein